MRHAGYAMRRHIYAIYYFRARRIIISHVDMSCHSDTRDAGEIPSVAHAAELPHVLYEKMLTRYATYGHRSLPRGRQQRYLPT